MELVRFKFSTLNGCDRASCSLFLRPSVFTESFRTGVFEVYSPDSIVSRLLLVAIEAFFWGDPVREI